MNNARLSPGERRALRELVEVYRHALVAERLGIALSTVRWHVQSIHRKTGTHSPSELIRWAIEHRSSWDVDEQA